MEIKAPTPQIPPPVWTEFKDLQEWEKYHQERGQDDKTSDALAIFLFPWALVLRGLGMGGVGVMALFVAILGLGWVYALREGILEWK